MVPNISIYSTEVIELKRYYICKNNKCRILYSNKCEFEVGKRNYIYLQIYKDDMKDSSEIFIMKNFTMKCTGDNAIYIYL